MNEDSKIAELLFNLRVKYAKLVGRPLPTKNGEVATTSASTYEINLVPQVKMQMIKAQKMRNLVLFICIVVSSVAVGVVLVLFGIKSGQDIAMSQQDKKLERMSDKLGEYEEFENLVTIQNQLGRYDTLTSQRAVLSRVFSALGATLQQGEDEVKLSNLRVDLETNVVTLEGQANAIVDPLIDYRVLESFKKSVGLTKFDYGRYVDVYGTEIPTQCIEEADEEGNALKDGESYYAWWNLTIPGCEATKQGLQESTVALHYDGSAEMEYPEGGEVNTEEGAEEGEEKDEPTPIRVKIWRTPQFDEWYRLGKMTTDGAISGVSHFESQCYNYRGAMASGGSVRWTSTNECMLAPEGLTVTGSSNGRDDSDNLVLRFSARVQFASEYFVFQNKHMIAIGPMGQNVTDSFVQIGGMFAQEAESCDASDIECLTLNSNNGESE